MRHSQRQKRCETDSKCALAVPFRHQLPVHEIGRSFEFLYRMEVDNNLNHKKMNYKFDLEAGLRGSRASQRDIRAV